MVWSLIFFLKFSLYKLFLLLFYVLGCVLICMILYVQGFERTLQCWLILQNRDLGYFIYIYNNKDKNPLKITKHFII